MYIIRILFFFWFIFLQVSYYSSAKVAILNGLTHEMQLSPGEKYKGNIQLQNGSKNLSSVKIYQTDYRFNYKGESNYDNPGTMARSNAAWVSVSSLFVTLQENETRSLEFEVAVPSSDTLKGTYWSVIMVEGITTPDTTAKKGISINTVVRYAIQIITHIGETGTSQLQFLKAGLITEEGINGLAVDMENTGERALRPAVSLELFDAAGVSQGTLTADPKRVYPGCSIRIRVPLEAIKPGKYTGVLVAECDEDHVFGSNISVEI